MKASEPRPARGGDTTNFTARLTIDVTPDLRGQIKIAAFQRGVTVADMLSNTVNSPPSSAETA